MSTPIVYGLSKCDTCRKARKWLDRAGIAHQFVDYREHRIPPEALKAWAAQLGGWDQLVNKAGTTWRALPATRRMPESEARGDEACGERRNAGDRRPCRARARRWGGRRRSGR